MLSANCQLKMALATTSRKTTSSNSKTTLNAIKNETASSWTQAARTLVSRTQLTFRCSRWLQWITWIKWATTRLTWRRSARIRLWIYSMRPRHSTLWCIASPTSSGTTWLRIRHSGPAGKCTCVWRKEPAPTTRQVEEMIAMTKLSKSTTKTYTWQPFAASTFHLWWSATRISSSTRSSTLSLALQRQRWHVHRNYSCVKFTNE